MIKEPMNRLNIMTLGDFTADIPWSSPRLETLKIKRHDYINMAQLPEQLTVYDILITDMAWLKSLTPAACEALHKRMATGGTWLALTDNNTFFKEQVTWLRTGVSHFLRKPLNLDALFTLIEGIHDRVTGSPVRVILLDDSVSALYYYETVLKQAGIVVQSVQDPLILLDILDDFKPDLLLMDIEMPACRGTELITILRQQPEYNELPVIYLTAMRGMKDLLMARQSAAEDYLLKPAPPELLVTSIKSRALRYREQQRMEKAMWRREEDERLRLKHLRRALDEHAIVSVTDVKGNIVYVNDRFCSISGYNKEVLLGKNHRMIKSDEHSPAFYRQLWQTIAKGKVWRGEVCNRKKNGELYWVEATIAPILNNRGKPVQYISIRTDVTHIKRIQERLIQSEERLKRGQLYANIGTWDWVIETGELYWSERIGPLFGYEAGELSTSYENFINAIHPDDRPRVLTAIEDCIEGRKPYAIEHRVVWPDGSVHWLLERGAILKDASGKALKMSGVVQDITDRKSIEMFLIESEVKLSEANQMLSLVLDNIPVRVFWKDLQSRYLGCNKAFAYDAGFEKPEDLIGLDDYAMPWALEADDYRRDDLEVINKQLPKLNYEELQTVPSGEHVWLSTSKIPLMDGNRQAIGILGVYEDITQRKQAEKQILESQERFSFAVEGAGDGIWDWNMTSGTLLLSGHYESMLGYEPGELEQTITQWKNSVHPEDLSHVLHTVEAYLADRIAVYATELRMRCKKGHYKWILCRGTVVERDENNNPVRMIGIHSDINDRKLTELALVEARRAAEKANQAKSDFLSSMSHELRTPMNAILGFAQLLEYEDTMTEEQQDSVHEIIKAGAHLLKLINEILDLAKVESGHIELSIEPLVLAEIIDECKQLVDPLLLKHQLNLTIDVPQTNVVLADRVRLTQVLLNLLSNAIKYNRDNGHVSVTTQYVDDYYLRIMVTDTGQGISRENIAQLFEPFNRLDAENSQVEGTGIGLTITHRLVSLMAGRIGVDSELGVGSKFWIELPVAVLASVPEDNAEANKTLLSNNQDQYYRVLCIDDNPINLKLVTQVLGKCPQIDLFVAHTPELGIELALAHLPDLILLDINMPRLDGYQVLKTLRSEKSLQDTPIIAITANAMARDIERGLQAGFSDYLTKPIDIQKFLNIVGTHLEA